MGGGAFRDAGAAIERVSVLEQEKGELEAELTTLRAELDKLRGDETADHPGELAKLRAQLASERADRKVQLRELLPAAKNLEAAQRAFHEANNERKAAAHSAGLASEELQALRAQLRDAEKRIDELREEVREQQRTATLPVTAVPENLDAYMKRILDERDELREEVRRLREALASKPRPSLLATLLGRR